MVLNTPELKIEGHPELIVRPITLDDLEVALPLIQQSQLETHGHINVTLDELHSDWTSPGFDLEKSIMAVFTSEGQIVALEEIWDVRQPPVRPNAWGFVHPAYRGLGVGTTLFKWAEQRARQVFDQVPEDARVVLEATQDSTNAYGKQFLADMGMVYANRSWLHMAIHMKEAPEKPVLPEGLTITTLAEANRQEDAYRAAKASFKDHRGHVEEPFEESYARFVHDIETDSEYDPSLHFLAMDGDTIAGVSFSRIKGWSDPDEAYIKTLGVVEAYRKRGLGLALLLHTLNVFWERNQPRVGLHVDGASITGATRLYEKAGMHIHKAYDAYEKELRPGRELSAQ